MSAINCSLDVLNVWFAWAAKPVGLDDQTARLGGLAAAFDAGDDYEFGVFETVTGDLVGAQVLKIEQTAAFSHQAMRSTSRTFSLSSVSFILTSMVSFSWIWTRRPT